MLAAPAGAAPTTPAPAITNDPNAANGSIAFYDAAGSRVTSGKSLSRLFDYALASSAGRTNAIKATLFFGFPDHTQTDSQNWVEQQQSASTTFPNASAPSPLNTATRPLVTVGQNYANYNDASQGVTLDSSAGYAGIVQVRLYDSGPGVPKTPPFWATDIYVDTSAKTWQQVFPADPMTTTSVSAISANPASPAASTTKSVALSATVSAGDSTHPAGKVELFNGTTDLGAAGYTQSTGAVTATAAVSNGGAYNFKFVFTPTDAGAYKSATSAVLAYSVQSGPQATSTTLTASPSGTAAVGADVTLKATITPSAAGTVQFKDGSATLGTPVTVSGGSASTTTSALTKGPHTLTAVFAPTDTAGFVGSTSNTVNYTIADVPAEPTAVTATAGEKSATVSWTAPSDNGGSPLTGYAVQYSTDAGSTWTSLPASSSTSTTRSVAGLTAGTSYVFRVAARNAVGTGAYSAQSDSVVPTAPKDTASALTISPSTSVDYGRSLRIFGKLTNATTGSAITGATVRLYYRARSNQAYKPGPTAVSNKLGVVSMTVTPPAKRYYEWRFAGSTTHKAVSSAQDIVDVHQTVTIAATPHSVAKGHSVRIWGVVSPSTPGLRVTLEHLFKGRIYNDGSVVTKMQRMPNGHMAVGYIFTVTLGKATSYTYQVYRPRLSPPTLLDGTSRSITVTAV